MRLPPNVGELAVVEAAAARGVAVATVGEHAVASRSPALLLGYARLPESGLRAAAIALLAAIDDVAQDVALND